MKLFSVVVLRLAVVAAGAAILALCIFGTWVVATVKAPDPACHTMLIAMLGGLYLTATPIFIALYQAMKLLGYIGSGRAFSQSSVEALKKIQHCAIAAFVTCTLGALPFLVFWANMDDAPGLIVIGMAIDGGAFVSAILASIIRRLLQDAIEIKSENDLII